MGLPYSFGFPLLVSRSSSMRLRGLIALSSFCRAMNETAGGRSLSFSPLIGGSSDWMRRSR